MDSRAKLIAHQSKIDNDLDKAVKVIEPFILTGKKITKREIDKAQIALDQVFGTKPIVEDTNNNRYSVVRIWLHKDYFNKVVLFHSNRSIRVNDRYEYISDYERHIYLNGDTGSVESIDLENGNLDRYIKNKPVLTESKAKKLINTYEKLDKKIKQLQEKQFDIRYHHMMK